ncbi:hypothetical protein DPSP01_004417 [Paraphaeosphaeria sporulosa]|uniref:Dabb-domain-containing protein n=1 Tax=Paraphaeosphaeria sporulosa TaxID=1460663 RepID=A0A177CJS7_9PLEO|nr:dabb-domain-containing protein [Paraphaeosphaeria sporulosa]OAG07080.1 dabb-domain-containing protein [Paraphaeosphaeria sporulosa]
MAIIHLVFFAWKSDVSKETITDALERLQALELDCVHPISKKPYIKSLKAGANNSPEGVSDPYTHGFVVEFESAEDRDYYVDQDPAHTDFKSFAGPHLAGVKVVDFEPGKF